MRVLVVEDDLVTALDDAIDIVRAPDGGADDYIAKPLEPAEVVARARAVLRRLSADQGATVTIGNLGLDVSNRMVRVDGRATAVPRRELAILEALIRRFGRVVLRGARSGGLWLQRGNSVKCHRCAYFAAAPPAARKQLHGDHPADPRSRLSRCR